MKPPLFEYHDPSSVEEACSVLAEHGDEAKVLAGGQSLVPLLNFRLARPDRLVDINGVEELSYIRRENGSLRIGALTRHSALEGSAEVAGAVPFLQEAVRWVGHAQIRNRGTVGGSVAHSDPSAELPVAMRVLDAVMHMRSVRGSRSIPAADFFITHLTTTMEPDELLVEIEVPVPGARTRSAFVEFARRHGDFALGGAGVQLEFAGDGSVSKAAVGLLAAAPTPVRADAAEAFLVGKPLDAQVAVEAAGLAIEGIAPTGDIHGSGEYRKELIRAMVRRALMQAAGLDDDGVA